jgi:hypothetical protein
MSHTGIALSATVAGRMRIFWGLTPFLHLRQYPAFRFGQRRRLHLSWHNPFYWIT